jgi:hypothetical protein
MSIEENGKKKKYPMHLIEVGDDLVEYANQVAEKESKKNQINLKLKKEKHESRFFRIRS